MPRQAKGPRLYRRRDTGFWLIRDTGRGELSTGTRDRREAEGGLATYIAEKDRPAGPSTPDQMTTAEALTIYGNERAPDVKDPVRIAYAILALVPIVGSLSVAGLTSEVCRRYAKTRGKAPGTIRKELGVLQAAVNYCHAEGYLTSAPKLRLPAKPSARDRWLTRGEVAKLLQRSLPQSALTAPCPLHPRGLLRRHEVRGHPADAVHAEHGRRMGGHREGHHAPARHRGGRDDQAAPANPDPAPASRPPSSMGAHGRSVRGRGRRAAGRQCQDSVGKGARRGGNRPLHPA